MTESKGGRIDLIERSIRSLQLYFVSCQSSGGWMSSPAMRMPTRVIAGVFTAGATLKTERGDRRRSPPRSPRVMNRTGRSTAAAEDSAEEPTDPRRSGIPGFGGNHSRAACFVFENGSELRRLCKPPLLIGAAVCEVE